jgi:hypothetical protein
MLAKLMGSICSGGPLAFVSSSICTLVCLAPEEARTSRGTGMPSWASPASGPPAAMHVLDIVGRSVSTAMLQTQANPTGNACLVRWPFQLPART